MAMQAGIGVSRILILAGAGYTGTIMLKNGKLSELLAELQSLVKGMEKSGEKSDGDSDYSDAIAQHGLKFSDLMYVTKRSMASAVSNLTKHLEQVSEALSTHLTQRIQHLDDKMESQKEISKAIQNDVNAASENLTLIGSELWQLQCLVSGLDGKIGSLEEKQDIANMGVMYLCNFVGGKKAKMPKALEDQLKPSGRTRASLTYSEVRSLTGLKELADDLSQTFSKPATDATLQDGTDNLEDQLRTPRNDQPRALLRFNSARC